MSDIIVGPSEEHPTHHFSLEQAGGAKMGFIGCDRAGSPTGLAFREAPYPTTVMRVSQGAGGYGDYEYPFTPLVQGDTSGGRGNEDFETDTTRYADSKGIDTRRGDILLAGKPTETLAKAHYPSGSGNVIDPERELTTIEYLTRYQWPGGSGSIRVKVKGIGNFILPPYPPNLDPDYWQTCNAIFSIYDGSWANPDGTPQLGEPLYRTSIILPVDQTAEFVFDVPEIAAGTWVYVGFFGGIAVELIGSTNESYWRSTLGAPMSGTEVGTAINFTYIQDAQRVNGKLFEYKGGMYLLRMMPGKIKSQYTRLGLYFNGYRGMVRVNQTDNAVLATSLDLEANALAGCILRVVAGPGSKERKRWRRIVSNSQGPNSNITVAPSWVTDLTTATEFVVIGTNVWNYISTGVDTELLPTDVLVVDDVVYMANGPDKNILRGRCVNSTWSWYWEGTSGTDAGGRRADFLRLITDTKGVRKIWRALSAASTVASASIPTWAGAHQATLAFDTDVICGSKDTKITNMVPYGSPQIPYILKEDSMGSVNNGVYAPLHLPEMENARGDDNGSAACAWGVYLFFSFRQGLERYYSEKLDDLGPDRDEGFPPERQGKIVQLIPVPGGLLAAYDAGDLGYSSVLYWNQTGWHEIYRDDIRGGGISAIALQWMPGEKVERLWIQAANRVDWIPWAMNPRKQQDYQYISSGEFISSKMRTSMAEIQKFWKGITLHTKGLSTNQKVIAYYRVDGETTWSQAEGEFTQSPTQELLLSNNYDVVGKEIEIKLVLSTDDPAKSPRVRRFVVDAVTRIPPKRSWAVTFMISDFDLNLNQDQMLVAADAIAAQLHSWADSRVSPAPLLLHHNMAMFDGKRVFIEPASLQPLVMIVSPEREIKLIGSMTLLEA